jgi:hypothetical protein
VASPFHYLSEYIYLNSYISASLEGWLVADGGGGECHVIDGDGRLGRKEPENLMYCAEKCDCRKSLPTWPLSPVF